MKFTRFTAPLLAALMVAGPMVTSSIAQTIPPTEWSSSRWQWSSPSSVTTDPWKASANIVGWLPSAPVTIDAEGQSVHLPEPFLVILKSLLFYASGHGEVHKGPFGLFVTPLYYKGEFKDEITRAGDSFDLEERVWLVNYGASYDLGTYRFGDEPGSPSVTLQPYAGATFFHDKVDLDVGAGPIFDGLQLDTTIDFNTPIFGLNTLWDISDRWSFRLGGHYGGFGVSDVDNTYQIDGNIAYHFGAWGQDARVFAGYRHVHIDYDDGELAINVNVTGPFLGVGVDF
jgi:hypothetical protein